MKRYLLYDVNPGEGFNLRRDVFIRIANLVRTLQNPYSHPDILHSSCQLHVHNWTLVLPPWGPLPHWSQDYENWDLATSSIIGGLPWSMFFDVEELKRFIPVIEFHDFQRTILDSSTDGRSKFTTIDAALYISRPIMDSFISFSKNSKPVLRIPEQSTDSHYSFFRCGNYSTDIFKLIDGTFGGFYASAISVNQNLLPVRSRTFYCLYGGALEAIDLTAFLLESWQPPSHYNVSFKGFPQTIYLGSAESLINGRWSEWSPEYWTARRSMIFSERLRKIADEFRLAHLASSDSKDRTLAPASWVSGRWPMAPALGGPYVALHWRRGDFSFGVSPDAVVTANQLLQAVTDLGFRFLSTDSPNHTSLNVIFVATDASYSEFLELRKHLHPIEVIRFEGVPSLKLTPGEAAIIDQWICSHARLFIGTSPSTFTFRITEERQIIGFPAESTYNTLCPLGNASLYAHKPLTIEGSSCDPLTEWPVVYESHYTLDKPSKDQFNQPTFHDFNEL